MSETSELSFDFSSSAGLSEGIGQNHRDFKRMWGFRGKYLFGGVGDSKLCGTGGSEGTVVKL